MDWMEKLEKAVNARRDEEMPERDDEDEDDDQDGEEEDEEQGEPEMKRPMKKSAAGSKKGRYVPKCNSEDEEDAGEPDVDDPQSIEKKTKQAGSGPAKFGGKGSGGFRKGLTEALTPEAADAIDASPVLGELVKSIQDSHANLATLAEFTELKSEVATLAKGLEAIGSALGKSLKQQNELVKGLRQEVAEQGRQPAGRRSQLRTIEKGFGGSVGLPIPPRGEMLKKSMAAVKAGQLTAHDAGRLEASYNRGEFDHDLWATISG